MELIDRGTLILFIAHVPFISEVCFELYLMKKLFAILPAKDRRFFPGPLKPWRYLYSVSLSQYVFTRSVSDSAELINSKKIFRQSIFRKISFGIFGFTVFVVLIIKGWRPL